MSTIFSRRKLRLLTAVFACAALSGVPFGASAHSVYIDAWITGDQMCTESSFSTKARAKHSTVTVLDAKGVVLREGVTNDTGVVCFPLPEQPMDLTCVVNAGQGHRAETTLYAEDFPVAPGGVGRVPGTPAPSGGPAGNAASPGGTAPRIPSPAPSSATASLSSLDAAELEARIRTAVREEVQNQMGPIRHSLAALQNKKPGMLEIFGGIGWIAGLAGAAALASTRSRQRRKD